MTVAGQLDAMRTGTAGIGLAVYADITSGTVLASSAATKQAQEALDRLPVVAAAMLDGPVAEGAEGLWSEEPGAAPPTLAIAMSGTEARLALRRGGDLAHALICVCALETDFEAAIAAARATLDAIAAG